MGGRDGSLQDCSGRAWRSSRRRFLASTVTAIAATVAGCSGNGDDGSTPTTQDVTRATFTPTPSTTGEPTRTPTPTTAETDATTNSATSTETVVGPEAARRIARRTVERIAASDYGAALGSFSAELSERYTERALEATWERQVWVMGGFDRVGSASATEREEGGYSVTVTVEGEYAPVEARVGVTGGEVDELAFDTVTRGSYSPPGYADEAAFTERSVTVDAGAGCPLPGTLTIPAERDGPVPGVVLVHGSGPNDRDETVGPQKPFKDLAWGLATRGIAVLRYRKRTAECSASPAELTPDWIAVDDAVAAVDVLAGADAVRPDGIGVVGHSLGGYLGPMIARRADEEAERADGVAALGLLAAPGRSLWRSNLYQYRQLVTMDGELSDAERDRIDRLENAGERIDSQGFPPNRAVFGQTGAFWNAVTDYDQVSVAAGLDAPTLVVQGQRDVQVDPQASPAAWRDGLPDDGHSAVRTYPRPNHLLIPGSGPSFVGRYYVEPGNVASEVIEHLAEWIPDAVER